MSWLLTGTGRGFAIGCALGLAVFALVGAQAHRERVIALNDLSYIWGGPRAVLDGLDPYDLDEWTLTIRRYGLQDSDVGGPDGVYAYPPPVALALVPLAALPLRAVSDVWTWGGLAIAIAALATLLRSARTLSPLAALSLGFALTGSQPAVVTMYSGQWGHLLVAAACWMLTRPERATAGLAAGALAVKPHLSFVPIIAFLAASVARHRWRAILALSLAVAVPTLASMVLLPGSWEGWLRGSASGRLELPRLATVTVALSDLVGDAGRPVALAVILLAAAVALAYDASRPVGLAAWIATGLVATPYARSYDHLILVVPLAVGIAATSAAHPSRALLLAAAGTALLVIAASAGFLFVAPQRGSESLNGLVPAAMLGLYFWATWPVRRATMGAEAP